MWAGFFGILIWGTLAPLLGSILPNLRERSGLSLSGAGVMFVALSGGMVVASLLSGPLLDRYGKKKVLSTAVALIAVVLVLFEVVHNATMLLGLAFLLGVGGSALVTGAHALLADLNPNHRAASLNLLDVFFGVGGFLTTFAIIPLQEVAGLAAVLLVLAGMSALVLVYLLAMSFPPPVHAREFSAGEARSVAAAPLFIVPALLIFLYVGTEQSVFDWQVTYFTGEMGMERVAASRALSWFPVALMLGRLVNSRILLHVSPTRVLVLSTLGATLSFAVILTSASALAASIALFVAGFCMASIYPTTLGLLSGRFAAMSGTSIGLAVTAGWFGSFLVSPTFGFVAQESGFTTGYLVILGTSASMLVVASLLARQESRIRRMAAVPGMAGRQEASGV
jgi:fucose permease